MYRNASLKVKVVLLGGTNSTIPLHLLHFPILGVYSFFSTGLLLHWLIICAKISSSSAIYLISERLLMLIYILRLRLVAALLRDDVLLLSALLPDFIVTNNICSFMYSEDLSINRTWFKIVLSSILLSSRISVTYLLIRLTIDVNLVATFWSSPKIVIVFTKLPHLVTIYWCLDSLVIKNEVVLIQKYWQYSW